MTPIGMTPPLYGTAPRYRASTPPCNRYDRRCENRSTRPSMSIAPGEGRDGRSPRRKTTDTAQRNDKVERGERSRAKGASTSARAEPAPPKILVAEGRIVGYETDREFFEGKPWCDDPIRCERKEPAQAGMRRAGRRTAHKHHPPHVRSGRVARARLAGRPRAVRGGGERGAARRGATGRPGG